MKLHRKYIRMYKRKSLVLGMSMALIVALVVCMFILIHSNHRVEAQQNMFIYTAFDYQITDLSEKQVNQIQKDPVLKYAGISRLEAVRYTSLNQFATIEEASADEITAVSKLTEGSMPGKQNEIVAERWALLNLGVVPRLGNMVTLKNRNTGEETEYKIVGILNDMALNKMSGAIVLYTGFFNAPVNSTDYTAMLKFKDHINTPGEMERITKELGLTSKQVRSNVWKEDMGSLRRMDLQLGLLLALIAFVIIMGVFRVFLISRRSQYGIFRAIGMKRSKMRKLILAELLELYLFSIPVGIVMGVVSAYVVNRLSGTKEIQIYFWGQKEKFQMLFPMIPILLELLAVGVCLTVIGIIGLRSIYRQPVMDTILENQDQKVFKLPFTKIDRRESYIKCYQKIALKYIFINWKATIFIVISICFGSSLFYGLSYQAKIYQTANEFNRNLNFYNGDFLMTVYKDRVINTGIKSETLRQIRKIEGVDSIETQMALPIKVIDRNEKRNEDYFAHKNKVVKRDYGFSLSQQSQGEAVYLTKLKGYNIQALQKLHQYIKEGDFDPEQIKEDEIILAMPVTSTYGSSMGGTGYFKVGDPIIQYHCGDTIEMKYRADLDTSTDAYWKSTDDDDKYIYKKYKIAAIVYYPYMRNASVLEQSYPLLITSSALKI